MKGPCNVAGKTDDINMPMIITIVIASLLLLATIVIGMQAVFFYAQNRELQVKVIDPPNWEIENLIAQQLANIQSYRWIDRKNDIVAIPIDRAVELTITRMNQQRDQEN